MPGEQGGEPDGRVGAVERRLSFLLDTATALAGARDYPDTLQRLAAAAVPELADLCLIDVGEPDGTLRRMAAVHADAAKADLVDELRNNYPPDPSSPHPGRVAMTTARPSWSETMPDDFLRLTTRDSRHLELVKALGFESYMCVPLVDGDEVLGSITLVSAGSGRVFDAADLDLPSELASRVATVVASARRHQRDRQVANDLQHHLLPTVLPTPAGIERAVRYLTATGAEAGGDFYDMVVLPSGRIGLMIGDIEGHDATAAALMGQLRSAARVLAGQFREPAQLVDALQWSWGLLGFERSATAVFARLDTSNGDLVAASAGHPPPMVVDGKGGARFVAVEPSPPLGVPGGVAVDHRTVLVTGETLVLYTDGLIESPGVSLSEGAAALLAVGRQAASADPEELCDAILAALTPEGPRRDDVALLAVQLLDSRP
ncbi:MAG TPA: GAF domain-containing SpoIIE family protein phosphatase [Acidimicrobiales bacterium]|jgi:serine/threonine-protein kinase RsbW|nr:GAF domain-containing SpoIIE family protein phosphatase [Acidimicrobiales bacterium]